MEKETKVKLSSPPSSPAINKGMEGEESKGKEGEESKLHYITKGKGEEMQRNKGKEGKLC